VHCADACGAIARTSRTMARALKRAAERLRKGDDEESAVLKGIVVRAKAQRYGIAMSNSVHTLGNKRLPVPEFLLFAFSSLRESCTALPASNLRLCRSVPLVSSSTPKTWSGVLFLDGGSFGLCALACKPQR